jgi:superoxide dismutase, Fe-Mn family
MFILPKLNYDYNSMEPVIDAKTMETHHSKHHQGYVDKLNAALEGHDELLQRPIEQILQDIDQVPQEIRQSVINNGGGHANHSLYWQLLRPASGLSEQQLNENQPVGKLAQAIDEAWGFEEFKDSFAQTAASQFGSGWGWLVTDKSNKLHILSTSNQDSPLSKGMKPILAVDVWEHAYYLKYQNRRAEYLEKFWSLVDWNQAEEIYLKSS